MKNKDLIALERIFILATDFLEKNIIRKPPINFERIHKQIENLSNKKYNRKELELIIKKINTLIWREIPSKIYHIFGGHGGVIINDIGFCEFDSPSYALKILMNKMQISNETQQPYNLEITVCCLEWLKNHYPQKFSEFLSLYNSGKFEIINPTYSQPYNLIIGVESNIKQFEYGIKFLNDIGIHPNIFYCSESSYHPQIPQILNGFHIKYGSLRTRLLGINPTANSAIINWIGLDNTSIKSLVDQSGVFNGEYWHGTFFKELPNLLFQAVARPFMDYILYSSIEDFMNNQPLQEDVWRITKYREIFGKFFLCSDLFEMLEPDGEYKYSRDNFTIGVYHFLISELFLQNKYAEAILLSAEIVCTLSYHYVNDVNDLPFDVLWKRLLLSQAHDCYAVPFIRTGDYSRTQLPQEDFNALNIEIGKKSISELSISICKEVQQTCQDYIKHGLTRLSEKLCIKSTIGTKKMFIFNPTPYSRRDIIYLENSDWKFIVDVPSFGYAVIPLTQPPSNESIFLCEIQINKELNIIQIKHMNEFIYDIKFESDLPYIFEKVDKHQDLLEENIKILGKFSNNQEFRVEIIQYKSINRIEFILESNLLKEIILTPRFDIEHYYVNYPFGIEETKRAKIQSLDFLWLKNLEKGILYIQKNSQQFTIDRAENKIKNQIPTKGRYEFAITITHENEFFSIQQYIFSYNFRLLSIYTDKEFEIDRTSLLKIEPNLPVTNLWTRKNDTYIRLFNPSYNQINFTLDGIFVKSQVKEIDLNYNEIDTKIPNHLTIGPWKFLTLKL